MAVAPFTRVLSGGEVGRDVEAVGRALCHAGFLMNVRLFHRSPTRWKRLYGRRKQAAVNKVRVLLKLDPTGVYDRQVHEWLRRHGTQMDGHFDAYAINLLKAWQPQVVHPVPKGVVYSGGSWLHETGGLPGNWALDWLCPAGTAVLAVVTAKVTKLSGSAPSTDVDDVGGTYGWSVHYESTGGYRWFWTHMGRRVAGIEVGDALQPGDPIGYVGDQKFRPDHIHGGVTSPLGPPDAKKVIQAVEQATRVVPADI